MIRTPLIAVTFANFALMGLAQHDPFTITINTSRTIYAQPDQVRIDISVDTDFGATLDQVVALLQPAGIATANFSGMFGVTNGPTSNDPPVKIEWYFQIAVPLDGLKSELDLLAGVQKSLVRQNSGTTVTYAPGSVQLSPEKRAGQCKPQDLIADARTQALALANAAGYGVGSVVALSDGTGAPILASRIGIVGAAPSSGSFITGIISSPPISPMFCTMVVVFRLTPQ